jgi:hypothetical protein
MKDIFYQLLATSADGALMVDEDQNITYLNKAALEILPALFLTMETEFTGKNSATHIDKVQL